MSTTTPGKTQGTALLAHAQQGSAGVTMGNPVDVSGKFAVRIFAKMGRTVATALTNELKFRLEGSAKSSGNDEWYPILEWQTFNGKTAANSTTVNDAAFNAGDVTVVLTSGTGITAGDILYFRETGTPANSEWSRVASISGSTPTLEEGVTHNHTNGINVCDQSEMFTFDIDVSAVGRIRLIVDSASAASGQTVDVIAWLVSLDSLGTV